MESNAYDHWVTRELRRRNLDWFGQFVSTQTGERIHYVEAGKGEPVVLVHGFLAWSYTWRYVLPQLAGRVRALAPDLRGFGLSDKRDRLSHSLNDQVEVLRAFLDALGIQQTVLCGHSMGGEVALRFALQYPQRVKALVLASASGYIRRRDPSWLKPLLTIPLISPLLVRLAFVSRRFALRNLRAVYHQPSAFTDTDVEAYLLPGRVPGGAAGLLAVLRDTDFGMTADRLREVGHKSLLIWGEYDAIVPLAHGQRLSQDLTNSRLVVFPGCGHVPPEECPELFVRTVLDFLAELGLA